MVEWSNAGVAGKRVILINRVTGQRASGFDWRDWDLALSRALAAIEDQGDLVSEIEEFLDGR